MKLLPFYILLLFMAAACRTNGPRFDAYSEAAAKESFIPANLTNRIADALLKRPIEPYRLGPGDVIDIEAVGDAADNASLTVGPDGKIYYSLLPGTSVWGLSIAESRALLQRELAKFTRATPELVVNLRIVASQRVWLLGAVQSPGVYALSTPTTLLEALAASGWVAGVDDAADLARSFVLRNGQLLPIDFERLLKHGDLSQNIYLAPDDFVFVRPANVPSVYLLGAVAAPHALPYSRDLSVAKVLAAGGPVKYAQQNRVIILRGSLMQPKIAEVDYKAIITGKAKDLRLEPGDIVYVPFSPFRRVAQMTEEVLDQFVRTVAVNEGSSAGGGNRPAEINATFGSPPPTPPPTPPTQ